MRSFKDVVIDNLPWIITALIGVGAFVATFKYQGDAIVKNEKQIEVSFTAIDKLEKNSIAELKNQLVENKIKIEQMEKSNSQMAKTDIQMTKISSKVEEIQNDIIEIKGDIRDIKNIILKPSMTAALK